MLTVEWDELRNYYFKRRNNRVVESYYLEKYQVISKFFTDKEFNQITVDAFLDELCVSFKNKRGKTISNSYYNKYLSMLRVIAKKCVPSFVLENMSRNEDEDRKKTEKLTVEEIERVKSICILYKQNQWNKDCFQGSYFKDFFFKLVMDVAILSTSRPGEFRKVKWSDIDDSGSHYKEPHLYLRLTKNGTTHKVYLPLYIREQLRSLPRYAHGYVFSIDPRGPFDLHWFNKELTNRCELVGIHKKITGKSLRGTGASMYLKKHKLQEVAKITNHKDINILYKHYYDEDEEIIENMIENNDIVPKVITAKDIIESFADWSKPFKTTIYYPAIKEAEAAIMTKLRVKSNKNDTNGSKNHISALNPA